jgi:hypothetical protein
VHVDGNDVAIEAEVADLPADESSDDDADRRPVGV